MARILNAAMRCIERNGPVNMKMEDVAAEAGLVRKTVYLAFGNRNALLDAVLKHRAGSNVERMHRFVTACTSLEEALIKGCIRHLQLLRKDKVLISVIEHAHGVNIEQFIFGPSSPVIDMMLAIWSDAFAAARARGELRGDLSDPEIGNWLIGVVNLMLKRVDLSVGDQEDLLRKFVLPALKPSALAAR